MNVVVKLFAGVRELAGTNEVSLDLPSGATVGQLREQLMAEHTMLRPLLSHAMFSLDAEYCNNDTQVAENAEIACIPPVSGG